MPCPRFLPLTLKGRVANWPYNPYHPILPDYAADATLKPTPFTRLYMNDSLVFILFYPIFSGS